jgi:hypothetical protein
MAGCMAAEGTALGSVLHAAGVCGRWLLQYSARMASILFLFERIAAAPRAVTEIANMAMTMGTAQSVVNPAIEAATRRHSRTFATYIAILVVTAIAVAVYTWLVWDSGNKMQDVIQADANARIEEGRRGVAKLENDNVTLQKDAAQAKAAQQKVELELEKQRERTATAERELLRLKETLKDRKLSQGQREELIQGLRHDPKGPIQLWWPSNVKDSYSLALQFREILYAAGWNQVTERMVAATTETGFFVAFRDARNLPAHIIAIERAFTSVGLPLRRLVDPDVPVNVVRILIGHKEQLA